MAAVVKERAEGICQLCNKPAPFYNKKGEPYLECHHIVWIARGGADEVYNAVALCPNCHRKMHSLDEPADVAYLKKVARLLKSHTIVMVDMLTLQAVDMQLKVDQVI